jgi:hypothetical protein
VTVGYISEGYEALYRPRYSFAEADRIARVTPNTSRRWLKGYSFWYDGEHRTMPPVTWTPETKDAVSFVDLMEVATIGKLRKKGFSFKRIRKINAAARFYLDARRPLVTERFKVKGRDIFVDDGFGILVDVGYGAGMQAWDEVLDPFLDPVEYEGEIVRRLVAAWQGCCGTCRSQLRVRSTGGRGYGGSHGDHRGTTQSWRQYRRDNLRFRCDPQANRRRATLGDA